MLPPEEDTLEPVETWPTDRLRRLQAERMRWSLRHAWERVPHYRHAFEDAGVHPDDLGSLSDLARFPLTARRDLRAAQPFGMFAVPRERLARLHASAGTTARPILVGHTPRDLETWAALMARSIRAAGIRPGWAVLVAHAYGLSPLAHGVQAGAERHGCAAIPLGAADPADLLRAIDELAPEAIAAPPATLLALLGALRAAGRDPAATSLRVALLGGAPWCADARARLAAECPFPALAGYGPAELLGPGIAQECIETRDGPTLWEDHFFPEIIDPSTGEVLPEGAEGELVLTSLTREAMPLVRCRTGDLARLLPPTARSMRRLAPIARLV